MLTASPTTSDSALLGSAASTSPVLTPVRTSSVTPHDVANSSLSSASRERISAADRTARSASSSWVVGMPKTAITASPMNFVTSPPWRSTMTCISSK